METARRILILLAIGCALGATGNALSPRGISWSRPLGRGVAADVAASGLVPIDLATVRSMLGGKAVWLIDARQPEEFRNGRIKGAVNIPYRENAGLTSDPPKDRWVILYCGNEFCEDALMLGLRLKAVGYRDIAVFVDGFEAWWNAGGDVDQD